MISQKQNNLVWRQVLTKKKHTKPARKYVYFGGGKTRFTHSNVFVCDTCFVSKYDDELDMLYFYTQ